MLRARLLIVLCAVVATPAALLANAVDPIWFDELSYRSVGPSRGGRSTTVTGHPDELHTFWMGTTGGGVWRTQNAGMTWENLTDGQIGVGSIGAVAVAPSDQNVLYVGTGSGCPRGNISVGDGLYRSTDAGKTWTHIGLREAGMVPRIVIDPTDPDRAFAAVLGSPFGDGEERGVYRTLDGGATWEKVLFASPKTGAVDVVMDPSNSRILYAALWRFQRTPWTIVDGGEESGVFKSVDGGDNWTRLEGGLPTGVLGRIGLSLSASNPKRVWALVTAADEDGGLYRSDDGGESFRQVSKDRELQTRGWYYSHVVASPHDENTVWVMNAGFWRSIDAGRTFERVRTPHGDNHDLWIHPHHENVMVEANDGGGTVSLDGGATWSTILNQPTAEFYRLTVDEAHPYRLYGAQQDNTTISVPSVRETQLEQQSWLIVAGGESGHIAVHPEDPLLTFAGNYLGRIDRLNRRTAERRNVLLYPQMQDGTAPKDLKHRFQWNAPIVVSRHEPHVLYHTSNTVHRSLDLGLTWETISEDLSYDDESKQELPGGPIQYDHTGVEVYASVFVLEESPDVAGELWAGTDDGRVHLSRDGGETWRDITPSALAEDSTVNSIDLSHKSPGRAVLAAHRYRLDDFAPYVFVTDDYGQSWRSAIGTGDERLPEGDPVRVVREDPAREGLFYAGTEFGMYVSFDSGESWQSLQLELPRTPITDLRVHRGDLVVATQGRSFWILDDLTPLHHAGAGVEAAELLPVRPAVLGGIRRGGSSGGARLHFFLPETTGEDADDAEGAEVEAGPTVKLEITNTAGEVVQRFAQKGDEGLDENVAELGDVEPGHNLVRWDLRTVGPDLVDGAVMSLAYTGGPLVPPGRYTAVLTAGEVQSSQSFDVVADPRRTDLEDGDLARQHALTLAIRDQLTEIHDWIETLRDVRGQLRSLDERARRAGRTDDEAPRAAEVEQLLEDAKALTAEITTLEEQLIQTKSKAGQDPINFPPRIDDQFAYLYSHAASIQGPPDAGTQERLTDLERELEPHREVYGTLLDGSLVAINERAAELGLSGILVKLD